MTSLTVVLLDHPPAVLNILAALILRFIKRCARHVCCFSAHAPQQECSKRSAPFGSHVRIGHSQTILWVLLFAAVIDGRVFEFMLEESFMVVPGFIMRLGSEVHWIVSV